MTTERLPVVGNWYRSTTGETFEVVACDMDYDSVEIQYFDGTVEELDLDSWQEFTLAPTAQPEDWSGSLDIEMDDYGVDLELGEMMDWSNPLDRFS